MLYSVALEGLSVKESKINAGLKWANIPIAQTFLIQNTALWSDIFPLKVNVWPNARRPSDRSTIEEIFMLLPGSNYVSSKVKKQKCKLVSCVWLFVIPWTVACQAPPSMEFSRKEYWSGYPFLSSGDLPEPEINLGLPHCKPILYYPSHQSVLKSPVQI